MLRNAIRYARMLTPVRVASSGVQFGHCHFPFDRRPWQSLFWTEARKGNWTPYRELFHGA